jgi:hypothetical protein
MYLVLYPFYALADLFFTVLTLILAPVLSLFANKSGNLPRFLYWFQTFDATLDAGWQDVYFTKPDHWWGLWWARTRWLWRNPGYGFSYFLLGLAFNPSKWHVLSYHVENNVEFFAAIGPWLAFNLYGSLGKIHYKIGWKAWNMYDTDKGQWKTTQWGPLWRVPCVLSLTYK